MTVRDLLFSLAGIWLLAAVGLSANSILKGRAENPTSETVIFDNRSETERSPEPLAEEPEPPTEPLIIVTAKRRIPLVVEIADSVSERERGLTHRPPLPDGRGMLFQYPDLAVRSYWMKDVPSPLDLISVGADGRIVSIAENTIPNSQRLMSSVEPAAAVLAVRAGWSSEMEIQAGDLMVHTFFTAPLPDGSDKALAHTWWRGQMDCNGTNYHMTLELETRGNDNVRALLRVRKVGDPLGRRALYPLRLTFAPGGEADFARGGGGAREWPNGYLSSMTLKGRVSADGDRLDGGVFVPRNVQCGAWSATPTTTADALEAVSLESTLPPDPDAPRATAEQTFGAEPH